ncbi:universal stress protein [Nitrosomonas supralitoralis]|uniref:Universal stress protein n=1 Tax=Nitrosomonas supralitoralis TaxID=2116706 RepID=A0A2P7NRH3_9PROT|nr:universal stress protein [Nitrosomonas supralitoralis]PSJ16054.1 universal stress protein [Nitrosomonas supralitoralis]
MLKILLPVDGSDSSNKAVMDFTQSLGNYKEIPEIHLLNVQPKFYSSEDSSLFIDKENVRQHLQNEGMKILQNTLELMKQAGLTGQSHILVGEPAEMIVNFAKEEFFDCIVIGTRGMGVVKSLLLGSVTNKVVQLSTIPVLLVK